MRYSVYPCLVSSFLCNPYIPFLMYEMFRLCTSLLSLIFLLLLAVTVIECNNNSLFYTLIMILIIIIILYEFGSRLIHAIMIPYDMIHVRMYAQELMTAKHDHLFFTSINILTGIIIYIQ